MYNVVNICIVGISDISIIITILHILTPTYLYNISLTDLVSALPLLPQPAHRRVHGEPVRAK